MFINFRAKKLATIGITLFLSTMFFGCAGTLDVLNDPFGKIQKEEEAKNDAIWQAAAESDKKEFEREWNSWLGKSIDDFVTEKGKNPSSSHKMTNGNTQYIFSSSSQQYKADFWGGGITEAGTTTCNTTLITNKQGIIQSWANSSGCRHGANKGSL